jgi:hypothetical protein
MRNDAGWSRSSVLVPWTLFYLTCSPLNLLLHAGTLSRSASRPLSTAQCSPGSDSRATVSPGLSPVIDNKLSPQGTHWCAINVITAQSLAESL